MVYNITPPLSIKFIISTLIGMFLKTPINRIPTTPDCFYWRSLGAINRMILSASVFLFTVNGDLLCVIKVINVKFVNISIIRYSVYSIDNQH